MRLTISLAAAAIALSACSQPAELFVDQGYVRLPAVKGNPGVAYFTLHGGDADTKLLGIVHFIPHPCMSPGKDMCYLQDLFTDPAARGRGIGTQLINSVISWCKEKGGISKVYWNTHATNPAREKLYDVVGTHSGFLKYTASVCD